VTLFAKATSLPQWEAVAALPALMFILKFIKTVALSIRQPTYTALCAKSL
jgi:hypothetical protein